MRAFFINYFSYLERKSNLFNFLVGLVCLAPICYLDWVNSEAYSFIFFYVFPVGFTTWLAGKRFGYAIAVIASIFSVIDNHFYFSFLRSLNAVSTLGVFIIISQLVSKVRAMLEYERSVARRDPLTGLLNSRAFMELLAYEIERFKREKMPFSLGYIDLDKFKEVNDRYGHQQGDQLLRLVADLFRSHLRKTDIVARMGGDEFAIFFPLTGHEAVQVVMNKVMTRFHETMELKQWPTTFSMGVVVFEKPPANVEEVIHLADMLMYQAKLAGKNRVEFMVYSGQTHSTGT